MLASQKADRVARSRGNPVDAWEGNFFFQQNVKHAACISAAGSSTLEYKTNRHKKASLRQVVMVSL